MDGGRPGESCKVLATMICAQPQFEKLQNTQVVIGLSI